MDSPEFRRSLDAFGTDMVPHNRVTLLQNGDEIFGALLAAIRGAKSSINIEVYIFDHGTIATRVARALAERARRGVEVRLLVDGFGSSLGDLAEEMTAAGVQRRGLQAPAHLLARQGGQSHAPADLHDRRPNRVLRRGGDRRPLERQRPESRGVARDDGEGRGSGRRAAPARLLRGLGPHDRARCCTGAASSRRSSPRATSSRRRSRARAPTRARWRSSSTTWRSRRRAGDLDRERLLRAGPPDPAGPRPGGRAWRRRPRHRAGEVHRQPERPQRVALPLRRASGRRAFRSTNTCRR